MGYGKTGTGTTGGAASFKAHPDANLEIVRLTITGNPTGGSFRLSHEDNNVGILLPHNPTTTQIADAVEALTGAEKVTVRTIGDTLFSDGVVDNPGHPYAGSFEIKITMVVLKEGATAPATDFEVPQLQVSSTLIGGGVTVETILEGGSPREKRMGLNWVSNITDGTVPYLQADFDEGVDTSVFGNGGPDIITVGDGDIDTNIQGDITSPSRS